MATQPKVIVPTRGNVPIQPSEELSSSSIDGPNQGTRSATPDEDAEGDKDEDYQEPPPEAPEIPKEEPSSGFKRKRNSQGRFSKSARLKATPSEEEDEDDEDEASEEESGSSSEVEAEWDADSDSAGDEEQENAEVSSCMFCKQDENDDPSEDFEEPYTCTLCGRKAHRQCARDTNSSPAEEDGDAWRCPSCIDNGEEEGDMLPSAMLRQSPAPKFARDLLPAQRGSSKPGSHSMFNTLILSDDPMDGSRSLRKRKASSESQDKPIIEPRKRSRRAASELERTALLNHALDGQADAGDTMDVNSPRTRGSRRTARKSDRPLVSIVEPRRDGNLIVVIRMPSEKLGALDHERRKRKKREYERLRREKMHRPAVPEPEVSHFPGLPPHTLREQYLFSEGSGDDKPKPKPYGGILSEAEADTSRSFPQPADMRKFEDARNKAEEQWKQKVRAAVAAEPSRPVQKQTNSASKIKCINFGGYEIDTWHAAPYPEEYTRNRVLYICEYCLKYMNSDFVAWRHKLKCPAKHPPGDEIYRDGSFSFFEVDGRKNPVYCQNLCLLAKLFLGSKTLYYDVDPFLFYIMTENDDFGCHFVGYFSKEKRPSSQNNVSCILVLPIHQRRGFGNFLIDFSYLLSRVEGKTGSPEKPLSDMGLVTYRSYWRLIMCHQLVDQQGNLSINELSERTGMTADDVICALEGLRALVRDPITKSYALRLDYGYMRKYISNYEAKGYVSLNEDALMWVPYVMGRDNQHYETAAPLRTVAQRDEGDDAEPEEGIQQAAAQADAAMSGAETASKQASTPGEQDLPTPFPPLSAQESAHTTAAGSKATTPKITATTPFVEVGGSDEETESIPATRFEIWPPVPGTGHRRKQGRPPKRPSALRNSFVRTASEAEEAPGSEGSTTRPSTLRRGRSKLGEVVNGEQDEEGDDETHEMQHEDPPSPSHGRGKMVDDENAEVTENGDVELTDAQDDETAEEA